MKHLRAYWIAVVKNNWYEQDVFFSRVVKRWQFDLDPTDSMSYGELNIAEYKEVQKAIQNATSTMLNELSNTQTIKTEERK